MKIFSSIDDRIWQFDQIEQNGKQLLFEENNPVNFEFTSIGNNRYVFILNGHSHLVHIIKANGLYHIHLEGDYFPVSVEDEQTRELRSLVEHAKQASGDFTITAPIPGLITKIKVNEGEKIEPGDGLVILEAMKMENEIKSQSDGIIKKILVKEGMPVDKDQEIIVIG